MINLKIDPEFQSQIPPLTDDEFKQLEENILKEGKLLSPLIVWNNILVDGHNRYEIVQEHPEISFSTMPLPFESREEVLAWICKNQLGRRNLTPEQKYYLMGKQYEAEKAAHGGDRKSSYAKMLTKELGHIDFSGSAVEIERLIRGLNSWPSAYTKYEGKTLKIWKSRVAENSEKEQQQKPGTIVRVTDDSIYVQTGDGVLELLEVQLEGKKRMQVKDFLLGHRPQAGTVLG